MEEAVSVSYKPTGTFLLLQWGTTRKRKGEASLWQREANVSKPETTQSSSSCCWPCWLWLSSTQLVFFLGGKKKKKSILLSKLTGWGAQSGSLRCPCAPRDSKETDQLQSQNWAKACEWFWVCTAVLCPVVLRDPVLKPLYSKQDVEEWRKNNLWYIFFFT